MMKKLLTTPIGRLRLLGLLEGTSLLVLVFIAVPIKYIGQDPSLVKNIGPIHGILFLLFVFQTLSLGVSQNWSFKTTTWKVLLGCIIPFGSFYIDQAILKKLHT